MIDTTTTLRELLANATPGPWTLDNDPCAACREDGRDAFSIRQVEGHEHAMFSDAPDAALIVAAVNALPALLDEIDALRAALAESEAKP